MAEGPRASAEVPLIGRHAELQEITAAFVASPSAAVVIAGPAGVGKSRLASDIIAAVASRGRPVLHVFGTQAGADIPFGAFVQLLPDVGPDPGTTLHLLQMLSKAVADLTRDGKPLLLLVDDAHLLDPGSAALVYQLVQSQSCGLIASVRTPDIAPDPIVALWKDGAARRIDLEPLSREDCDALAASYLGGVVASASLQWLWKVSAGNPLFVRELLVGARDSGSVYQQDSIWFLRLPMPAPARLTDLIRSRLAAVASTTADVVELLALGEPLGYREIVGIAGSEPLEDAERRGLIMLIDDRARSEVRLAHPLYAELVRSQLAATRARRLSLMLVDALERSGARRRDDVMRIARWRLEAGALGNPELMEQAARQARSVRDFALAGRLARAALAGGGGVTAGLVLAETEFTAGRHQEAEKVLVDLAPMCTTDEERALIANARAYNLGVLMGDAAAASAVIEEALATVREPAQRSRLLARQAITHVYSGQLTAALKDTDELLASADEITRRRGAYARSVAFALLGQTESAVDTAYEALDEHRRSIAASATGAALADYQPPEAQLVGAVLGHMLGGRLADADRDARIAYDVGLERHDNELQATFCLLHGWAFIERGLLVQAANLFREGTAINRELADLAPIRWCLAGAALAESMYGDELHASEAVAELDALPSHWMVAFEHLLIDRCRAWLLVASGQQTAARSLLSEAAVAARAHEQATAEAVLLHDVVRLGAAKQVAPRLTELAAVVDGDFVVAYAAHASADVRRDPERLEAVAKQFEDIGAMLLAAEVAAEAAKAYAAAGNDRRASAQARESARLQALCEVGHSPLLATIDVAVPLTRRELEIAQLASAGMSSKVMAERLVLSVRTVDNHLQHVYAKLGVTNRAQLEQTLRELGLGRTK